MLALVKIMLPLSMIHQDVMCWPIAPVGPERVYDLAKNEICSSPYLLNGLLAPGQTAFSVGLRPLCR